MTSIIPARRRKQLGIVLFVFVALGYLTWTQSYTIISDLEHNNHSHPPPSRQVRTPDHLPAEYGTTTRPPLKDLILDAELPVKFLPKLLNKHEDNPDKKHEGRRLIFIGDVHGMLSPLKELLDKIKFDAAAGDHVIFTGDLVMKGPDTIGVVQYAMDIGASAVRGNHEDRVLLAAQQLELERRRRKHNHKGKLKAEGDGKNEQEDTTKDIAIEDGTDDQHQYALTDPMEEEHFSHGDSKDRALARQLSTHQLAWLGSLPVILKVGHLPPMGDVVSVHAGLVPGVPLEKQDPWAVMNMRSLLYLGDEVRVEFARLAVTEARRALEPDEKKKDQIIARTKDREVQEIAMRDSKAWDNDVFIPVASREGERWAKVWEKEMKTLAKELGNQQMNQQDQGQQDGMGEPKDDNTSESMFSGNKKNDRLVSVVFGHDSRRGLQLGKFSYGIDSGCVRGGQLTALIVEASSSGKHVKSSIESVECKSAGKAAEKSEDDFKGSKKRKE